MPSPEELAQIIKEMRSQGLSDSEILETLQDMGVPGDVIRSALGGTVTEQNSSPSVPQQKPQASSALTPSAPSEESASPPEPSSDDLFAPTPAPARDVLSELMTTGSSSSSAQPEPVASPPTSSSNASQATAQETPTMPKSDLSAGITTPPILEEESVPAEKLDEIHSKVDALHKALSASDSIRDDVAEVKEMLRELKRDMHEVKSMFSAIQHILQQILETDRSILVDLYEKSKK